MKSTRIIAFIALATFSGAGAIHAAVIRHQSEENPLGMLKSDSRPSAAGFNDNTAGDSASAEVMKTAAKKKKTKTTKAS